MVTVYTQSGPVNLPDADLLWAAAIKDDTVAFFANFDHNVQVLQQRTSKAFKDVGAGSEESAESIGFLAGVVGGVTAKLFEMGVQALQSFGDVVKASIQIAARADTLAISLDVVGRNAGYSSEQIEELTKSVEAQGITTIEARQNLLKMSQAQLNLADASDLARVAQDAAVIAGINSSEAFGRLIHGITTLNPLVLRHMGILVNLEQAYSEYAGTIDGLTVKDIPSYTKVEIAKNEVLKAGATIAGTYEAAMETAGKQAGTLARHAEQLQLAFGDVFQDAYLVWIRFLTESLISAREWFDENADSLAQVGYWLGVITQLVLDLGRAFTRLHQDINPVLVLLKTLPKLVIDTEEALVGLVVGEQQAAAEADYLGERFKQLLVVVTTFVATAVEGLRGLSKLLGQIGEDLRTVSMLGSAISDPQGYSDAVNRLKDLGGQFEDVQMKATEAGQAAGKYIYDVVYGAEAAKTALGPVVDTFADLEAQTLEAVSAIEKLNEKFAEEMEKTATREARNAILRAIRESHRREDIERRSQERMDDLLKDAAKRRAKILEDLGEEEQDLAEDNAKEIAELERDYRREAIDAEIEFRRELRRIQQDFEFEASELARKNDAVGLARLIRNTQQRIKEAKEEHTQGARDRERDRKRDLADLQQQHAEEREELRNDQAERLEDLEEYLAERMQEVEEARQEDYENLERSLARDRQVRELQRAWEEEDRRDKFAKEAAALGLHLGSLEQLNQASVDALLNIHGEFIKDDLDLWQSYYTAREQLGRSTSAYSEQYDLFTLDPETGELSVPSGDVLDQWRYATGGMGIATREQQITIGESGPEAIMAIPLNRNTTHKIDFSTMRFDFQGVSPQMERDLKPMMYEIMTQFATSLSAAMSGGM